MEEEGAAGPVEPDDEDRKTPPTPAPPAEVDPAAGDPLDVDEFNKLMEERDASGEHPVWVEKYARDAEEEAGGALSKVDRLRREGWRLRALSIRYRHWETQYEKVLLAKAIAASERRAGDLDDELTPGEAAEYGRWNERRQLHAMDASRRLDMHHGR